MLYISTVFSTSIWFCQYNIIAVKYILATDINITYYNENYKRHNFLIMFIKSKFPYFIYLTFINIILSISLNLSAY